MTRSPSKPRLAPRPSSASQSTPGGGFMARASKKKATAKKPRASAKSLLISSTSPLAEAEVRVST